MIRRNHRGGQTIQQLSIPLLTGHHQNLLQGELPGLGQKTDGLTAGRALGKNIQEPMATELRFRLQTMAAQALTGQTNQAAVGSTQQVADLEGTLMIRVLKLKVFLELTHRCEHSLAIPGLAMRFAQTGSSARSEVW